LGIAECAHADVDLTFAEFLVPVLRIVDAVVPELPGARRHSCAELLWEALQRTLRKTERFKTRIRYPDPQPGISRGRPARGGIDEGRQPAEEFAARLSIVDAQERVSAEIRRWPLPENGRLNFMQFESRRAGLNTLVDGYG